MKKLNNKGYLLVEIVVAFSLAMAIMYLAADLTIKVKNKNDELMIKMLTMTDQTIIYNTIMREGTYSSCPTISGKTLTYSSKTIILNDYVSSVTCNTSTKKITITPKIIKEKFDVVIPAKMRP